MVNYKIKKSFNLHNVVNSKKIVLQICMSLIISHTLIKYINNHTLNRKICFTSKCESKFCITPDLSIEIYFAARREKRKRTITFSFDPSQPTQSINYVL